jgi:hypothetical protein
MIHTYLATNPIQPQNKIITENFQNLEKAMPIHVQEASRTPNRLDKNRTKM